ncbi:MAG: bifunctional tetrahydrofolate synthase/dihydrofolate synthase [Burkholderiales bacterium]
MASRRNLAEWLIHMENMHPSAIDMGLERVAAVRDRLGLAPLFPIVTVAGTNGKGSVCALLESIFSRAGYKVGQYSSPHLLRFNERIRVGRKEVSDADIERALERVEQVRAPESLTYFEFGTLAAMDIFIREKVEVAVLEVGLGGRLDAVNVFEPDCAVVTLVDLDHTAYLGPDRESIGREKAGIFRAGIPAVCGDPDPPASLLARAAALGAPLTLIDRDFGYSTEAGQWQFWSVRGKRSGLPHPVMRGNYQIANAATALAALEQISQTLPVDMGAIRRGLIEAELNGRFQVLPGKPMVILDVGHNPHAARALATNLRAMPAGGRTLAVFAMLKDKDIPAVAKEIGGEIDAWYVAGLTGPRGADAGQIVRTVRETGTSAAINSFETPAQALDAALGMAGQDDKILVFGSFYTVAEIMRARNAMERHG